MRKLIIIIMIAAGGFGSAQDSSSNVFSDAEQGVSTDTEAAAKMSDPGDPNAVPIDGFLPALIIAGIAFAAYSARKKIKMELE